VVLSASVVIATYQRPEHVRTCLEHLTSQTVAPMRTIVVDASPGTETREVVRAFPGVEYRRNERGAGSTATSRRIGVSDLREDVVAFIDDDAYAEPEWLGELLRQYTDASVAGVGGRARNGQPDEERIGIGQIGLLLPNGGLTGYFSADPGRVVPVDHMLGANMSVRLSAVRSLGGIRDLYPGTCLREETDIALRMRRAGLTLLYTPTAVVRHVAGQYARGKRFDLRYRYYGSRNHVVLLATTLGWRDPHVLRYGRTIAKRIVREVAGGARTVRRRPTAEMKARGLAGGITRAAADAAGTLSGVFAAAVATLRIRRAKARR
jgi:GT2 family glycosyltransferase